MTEEGLLATGRREAIWLALAAAEISWVTPLFLVLSLRVAPHAPFLIWAGMLLAQVSFFYFYRALVRADLPLRLQQGLVAGALLLATNIIIVWLGGYRSPNTWMVVIIYFTTCHATLVLLGVMGLARAMAGQCFRYPLVGRPL